MCWKKRWTAELCGAVAVAAFVTGPAAEAEFTVLGWSADGEGEELTGGEALVEGLGLEGSLGFSMTKPGSDASLSLRMIADQTSKAFINDGGEVLVTRGLGEMTDLGENVNGSQQVLGQWEEFVGKDSNTIQVIWMTEAGEDLLPLGATVDGKNAFFLEWRFGGEEPIELRDVVDPSTIELINATMAVSDDQGENFDIFNISSSIGNPWDGTDTGISLPLAGQGINMIVTQYEFTFLPGPGTAVTLLGLGVVAARRRRVV